LWGRETRYYGIDRLVNEITEAKKAYGVDFIQFLDETFVLNKKRVNKLCEELRKLVIDWICSSRVDSVDYELMKMMYQSGCRLIQFGLESGSQGMLDIMGKGITVNQSMKAIALAEDAGLKVRGQLIVGFPGETDKSIEETASLIKWARKHAVLGLHTFVPHPGSDVWENSEFYAKEYGYEFDKDTDFSTFRSAAKPGETLFGDDQVMEWYRYLKGLIGDSSIERQGYDVSNNDVG
jgi:radical SAM superfamily enzyme YgiQ (UPF0313 family)